VAIIGTATGPYVLDALNEEIIIGPGGTITDINLSDTEALLFNISSTTGTWTITTNASLDGVDYFAINLGVITSFPSSSTVSASASTISNIYIINHSNLPYIRFRMTAYTSGVVTLGPFLTRRTGTR